MTKLVWHQDEARRYELGIDRGVLYPEAGPGVAWNGLTSVNEIAEGVDHTEYFLDGIKYKDVLGNSNFQADIQAFSTPPEFDLCLGIKPIVKGFSLTRQPKSRFGLSYRTLIGDLGYKIHIVYNALATVNTKDYKSQSESDNSPAQHTYKISAIPPDSATYRPTAHFVVDSTKSNSDVLLLLESYLYGTDAAAPTLPEISVIIDLFNN